MERIQNLFCAGLVLVASLSACSESIGDPSYATEAKIGNGLGLGVKNWATSPSSKMDHVVFGYLGNWSTSPMGGNIDVSTLPWTKLTHLMEAFAVPADTSGTVSLPGGTRTNLISTAHSNSTRVYLSLGGAAASTSNFSASVAPAVVDTFVANIMSLVTTNSYDGVDIDWEFPGASDKSNFTTFMTKLSTALRATNGYDGDPRGLTFFVSPGTRLCGMDFPALKTLTDYATLSGYDYGISQFNGPLVDTRYYQDCFGQTRRASVASSVETLVSLGWPLDQLVLGAPLYASASDIGAVLIIGSGTFIKYNTPQAEASYTYSGSTRIINTSQSFCDKMTWAASNGLAGVGLWELSHAYPPTHAAVASIWSVIGGGACVSSDVASFFN